MTGRVLAALCVVCLCALAGCGNGAKIAQLVRDGAVDSVGLDISGNFVTPAPSGDG